MIPIFLWSTVNSHSRQPVACVGRAKTPVRGESSSCESGWATSSSVPGPVLSGRSVMIAIRSFSSA